MLHRDGPCFWNLFLKTENLTLPVRSTKELSADQRIQRQFQGIPKAGLERVDHEPVFGDDEEIDRQ